MFGCGKGGKVKGKVKFCFNCVGFQFFVGCIYRLFCNGNYVECVGVGVFVYLVVVMEYFVVEVFELVGNVVRDNKKIRIIFCYF